MTLASVYGFTLAPRGQIDPYAVTIETVLWSIIGLICAVGGVLLLAAGWSLVRRRPDR